MRTVFIGSPPFATECFAALLANSMPPVGLITSAETRAGRGRKVQANPLVELAEKFDASFPILRPHSAKDVECLQKFQNLEPDLGIVVSYGQILSQEFLDIPKFGCINIHGSLLPRWRGASPIQAAIKAGDSTTGISIQKMVYELDAGDVLAEREIQIGAACDSPQLFKQLSQVGAELLVEFIGQCKERGSLPPGQSQDQNKVTICKKIKVGDAVCDWSKEAPDIDRHIRAMAGWPWARTTAPNGAELKILSASVIAQDENLVQELRDREVAPSIGELIFSQKRMVVTCGEGFLEIHTLQRPGKSALPAEEFLRGFALNSGDCFT